jgi:beta-barrel assembly-enhancing protease
MRTMPHLARRVIVALAAATLVVLLSGCKGDSILGLSMEDEIRLGRQSGDQFEKKYGRNMDRDLNAEIVGIGRRIAARAKPPDYPYDYRVLNSQEVNANAFPGGRIYVWMGLINRLGRDPDKLAFVIGHETTHVAHRHTAKVVERAMGYDLAIQIITGGKNAEKYAGAVAGLMLQGFGRQNEYEADQYGVQFAHDAGYDPTAAYAVIREFQKIGGNKDPSSVELLFDTHPGNNDRLNAIRGLVERNGWKGKYKP